jgi:GNAT superfamily N-acetyltransferase
LNRFFSIQTSSQMPLRVEPMLESDVENFGVVQEAAYGSGPVSRAIYTRPPPPESSASFVSGVYKSLQNPEHVNLKVVDVDTGERISYARYFVFTRERTEEEIDQTFVIPPLIPESVEDAHIAFFTYLYTSRRTLPHQTPHIWLASLVTLPAHQRRGAGGMLLTWGIDKAQELGLDIYLQGSSSGYPLYKKYGFKDLSSHTLDLRPFGVDDETTHWVCYEDFLITSVRTNTAIEHG